MKIRQGGGRKVGRAEKRRPGDLPAKKADVRGGRDAASGLPTGKRQYKPVVL